MTVAERPPWLHILTPLNTESRSGGRCIVLGTRPYRSSVTTLNCFCRRRRKNGTCRTLDQIIPLLRHPSRVRLTHSELDELVFRVPTSPATAVGAPHERRPL
jgi:hypothetical protein